VTQQPQALLWLEDIERRGLFASVLDLGDELTLKLHDLFREFLEDRLRREQPAEWPALLQRAAATEPDPLRRIVYLQRAGDWAEAERQLAAEAPAMLVSGGGAQALRLVEQFPETWRAGSARLASVRGIVAWTRFEWRTMHEAMRLAVEGFDRDGEQQLAAQARAADAMALTALGRLEEGSAQLEALRELPPSLELKAQVQASAFWVTGAMGPAAGPATHLAALVQVLSAGAPAALWYRCAPHFMLIGREGMNAALEKYIAMARSVAGESHAPLRAVANILDAWLLLWRGEMAAAGERFAQVNDDDRWLGQPRSLRIPILGFRCVWHSLRGETEPFRAVAAEIMADVDADPQRRPTWRGVYLYMLVRMAAALEDWDTAERLRIELQRTPRDAEWPYVAYARATVAAQFALREGRPEAALQALEPAAGQAHEIDSFGLHATARLLLAQSRLALGDAKRAAAALAPLTSSTGADELGGVLLTGPSVIAGLAQADWQGALDDEAQSALRRWHALALRLRGSAVVEADHAPASEPQASPRSPQGLLARLSDREREVLECIAAGDSNKLIARRLDLSPHTVKRHVANILDKLALSSRGQAAAWYLTQADGPAAQAAE
jgi:LuxR family maltose regulon positive regulatory protein